MHRDARGVPVSGGSAFARDQYEVALRQFQSYVGDPVATLDAALADSPQFVVGHLFRALAMFTMTEKSLLPEVARSLDAARALQRERQRSRTRARGRRRSDFSTATGTPVASRSTTCSASIRATRSRCRPAT